MDSPWKPERPMELCIRYPGDAVEEAPVFMDDSYSGIPSAPHLIVEFLKIVCASVSLSVSQRKKSSFLKLQSYYEDTVREESCRVFGKFIRKTQRPTPRGPSDTIALEKMCMRLHQGGTEGDHHKAFSSVHFLAVSCIFVGFF